MKTLQVSWRVVLIWALSVIGVSIFALVPGQYPSVDSAFYRLYASPIEATAQQQNAQLLSGAYVGTIAIDTPLALGILDVSLVLTDTSGTLSGVLDSTGSLAFPSTTALQGSITGSIAGITSTFRIDAAPSADLVSGRQVTRSFRLDGIVEDAGNVISGLYTETISGFTPQPLAVSGRFLASRAAPVSSATTPTSTPTPTATSTATSVTSTPTVTPTPTATSAIPTPTVTATASTNPMGDQKVHLPIVSSERTIASIAPAEVATAMETPTPALAAPANEAMPDSLRQIYLPLVSH